MINKYKPRVYISGPMSGSTDEDINRRFGAAAQCLKAQGYDPINPVHISNYPFDYDELMEIDLKILSYCDGIYMLKELKRERQHVQKLYRHNPMQYVQEYIGTLDRRIAAYEKILPYTRELCYIVPKEEVKVLEYWNL